MWEVRSHTLVVGLHQSVLKSGLLTGTLWNGGTSFSLGTCCRKDPASGASELAFGAERTSTHQQLHRVHTKVFRSSPDLLWKEENGTLFSGLVSLRAFKLMVSEAFLDLAETESRLPGSVVRPHLTVTVTKCRTCIHLIIDHGRFLKIST